MKRSRPKKNKERDKFRDQICQLCGGGWASEVHEIAFRSKSKLSVDERATWLALCWNCHKRMHNPMDFPIERQYALKYVTDPDYYDHVLLNVLRGRQPEAINWRDIAQYLTIKDA